MRPSTKPTARDTQAINVPAGTAIFRQGEIGDCAYFVEDGLVDIIIEGDTPRLLVTRTSGELFGEMAIIDGGRRAASAIARMPCRLLPIGADRLSRFLARTDPMLRMVVDTMLRRLREQMLEQGERAPEGADESSRTTDAAARQAIMLNAIGQIRRENDFKKAIARREIGLFHQPIIALSSGQIVGFEALARWHHPERGIVSPGEFIPLAESSGMIGDMTRLCVEQAIGALPQLTHAARQLGASDPFINVNVSSSDLTDDRFADFLEEATAANPSDRKRLKIEITESALMENPDVARRTLERCRDLGIGIAVDDFGTGYSSLAYLHTLPINVLKVDRSFVASMASDPHSVKIVRTIIRLAEELGLPVVCEGLEFSEDVGTLTSMGCDFGQGFHFARPMPIGDVARLFAAWAGRKTDRVA